MTNIVPISQEGTRTFITSSCVIYFHFHVLDVFDFQDLQAGFACTRVKMAKSFHYITAKGSVRHLNILLLETKLQNEGHPPYASLCNFVLLIQKQKVGLLGVPMIEILWVIILMCHIKSITACFRNFRIIK